ncbi:MAG: hypothetical protein OHK0046_35050 [Anaerolineae bacterium]
MKHVLIRLGLLLTLLTLAGVNRAQPESTATLNYGEVITGQIDNTNPSRLYSFEGLRCDFLSVRVRVTNGDLDPVVTILDSSGSAILTRDDSAGDVGVDVEPVAIPRSGRYVIVVGRFGYGLGSTSGSFELLVERIGNRSAHGCALRYGDEIVNGITDLESRLIFQFRGAQGDLVNIRMERVSGDLDPYLTVTDNGGFVLASNDDVLGSGQNAEIQALVIPADGTYYVIATRYGEEAGGSTGNFLLSINEAEGSGLGNSALAAVPLRINTTIDGEITGSAPTQYYRFEARQNDIINVRMDRASGGALDSYLVIANSALQELAFNDDSNETQNALIENFLIPADGTYYILATRYEREAGTTTGRYTLSLESTGNAFASVPPEVRRISYGISLTGSIDDVNPSIDYAFWAEEGDVITLSLSRGDGDLDPVLSLLASDRQTTLATDDDSGSGQNARIERYEVATTGVYYIRVGRYTGADNPGTEGSYVLVLARRFDE